MLNINKIQLTNTFSPRISNQWLDVINLNEQKEFTGQVESIYRKHQQQNKWILVVNPESNTLNQLQKNQEIDGSKILCVHPKKVAINIEEIEKTLCKGNCAAVVICSTELASQHIEKLHQCASKGKTHCIVLNKPKQLH